MMQALLLLLLVLVLAVVQPPCNAATMPENPPRYDPLALKKMYYALNRNREVTPQRCAELRAGVPDRCPGALKGCSEEDATILNYIQVHPTTTTKLKLLCISYTYEGDHAGKGVAMASSWMHRCDGALVLSNATDPKVPAVAIPHVGPEVYGNIWQKIRNIWKYIHDEYMDDYDYFVIGGTDYYVIVENLRAYLESEALVKANSEEPLYLGRRFAEGGNLKRQFNSGGPSYILNKKALSLMVTNIEKKGCNPTMRCPCEDVQVANCLRTMSNGKVLPYDTRDSEQRELFHPFTPVLMAANPDHSSWFKSYSPWGLKQGLDAHAPESIAWHYTRPPVLRFMEDLLYACPALDKRHAPAKIGQRPPLHGQRDIRDIKKTSILAGDKLLMRRPRDNEQLQTSSILGSINPIYVALAVLFGYLLLKRKWSKKEDAVGAMAAVYFLYMLWSR